MDVDRFLTNKTHIITKQYVYNIYFTKPCQGTKRKIPDKNAYIVTQH